MNRTLSLSSSVRIIGVCAALLVVQACRPKPPEPPPPPKPSYTKEFLKSVLQNLTLEPLGPAGTAVEVLADSPQATKLFIKAWADSEYIKAVDMEQQTHGAEKALWDERLRWYDAVGTCMGTGDCSALRREQEAKDRAKTKSTRPLPPPPRQIGGEAGGGEGEAEGHQ